MRRRIPPAPHGFDINSRVSFLLGFYVLFAARIPDTGHFCPREHNRRAAGGRPLTGFPGVLLITTTAPSKVPWLALFRLRHTVGVEKILVNTSSIHCGFLLAASAPRSEYGKPVTFSVAQSQPPRLTCGANMEYHYPSIPRVMAKQSAGLLVRQKWIARCKRNTANGNEPRRGIPHRSWRFPPCRLPGRECTCCAGYSIVKVHDLATCFRSKVLKAKVTDAFGRRHQGCSGEYNVFPRVVREGDPAAFSPALWLST